ncbi:MAG: prepilin-type N-terminal cleavage/methylation domain-containing protein [Burkholderiaceae bacterium]
MHKQRAFTLIEMVVVLTLLGVLLTIAVPRYFHIIDNGRASVQRQNISTIRDAIDKFKGDLGRYPDSLEELVTRRYLREVPLDPVGDRRNWTIIPPADPNLGAVFDIRPAVDPQAAPSTQRD